jgi:hypothetical protein
MTKPQQLVHTRARLQGKAATKACNTLRMKCMNRSGINVPSWPLNFPGYTYKGRCHPCLSVRRA